MARVGFEIDGLDEVLANLQQLPSAVEYNAVRGGLVAGCEVIAQRARETLQANGSVSPPSATAQRYGAMQGQLMRSIKVLPLNGSNKGWVNCKVSAGSKIAYYARWVEFGTAPHQIKSMFGKILDFGGTFRQVIDHPGARAKPFMRPALDGARSDAVEAFVNFCKQQLQVQANLRAPAAAASVSSSHEA